MPRGDGEEWWGGVKEEEIEVRFSLPDRSPRLKGSFGEGRILGRAGGSFGQEKKGKMDETYRRSQQQN